MNTLDNLLDRYYPVGTVEADDKVDVGKAELMTELIKHHRTQFRASLIDYIEGLIPARKDFSTDPEDEWEQSSWVGYNKAIDDMRAKLKEQL